MILTVDLRSEPDPTLRDGTGVPKLTSLHIMHTFYRIRYSEIVLVLYIWNHMFSIPLDFTQEKNCISIERPS